jgi:hypothetical protein
MIRKRGGSVVWNEGKEHGTQVKHTDGKHKGKMKSAGGYKHGGAVDPGVSKPEKTAPVASNMKGAVVGEVKPVKSLGKNAIYAPPTGVMAPHYKGGSGGGTARLAKRAAAG